MNSQDDIKLNYRVSGKGDPVVLLHGFLESMSMWENLHFDEKFQVIQIDLPGHGNSSDDFDFSMREMAKEVCNVLRLLDIKTYHVIGHSMGGYVALEVKKADKNCKKLVMLNSNFWTDSPSKREDRVRVAKIVKTNKELFLYEVIPNLFRYPEKYDELVKELIREAGDMSPEAIGKASIAMSERQDFTQWLNLISPEILIIQGVDDAIVDASRMKIEAEEIGLKIELVENCGHMAHVEARESVIQIITTFLA